MDARLLVQLAEIVNCGSMRSAAERLNVTQPTLTRNIKILEDRVGSPVLRRTTKGVEPTTLGRRLAERGQDIGLSCGLARETVAKWHKGQDQEIRIGVGPLPAITFMGPYLEWHLGRRNPIALHVRVASPSQLSALVDEGKVDIAIAPAQLNQHYANLHQELLLKDELAVMVRKGHPLIGLSDPALIEGLSRYDWVSAGSAGIDDGIGPALRKIGVERPAPMFVLEGALSMAFHVVGNSDLVAALPRQLVEMHRIGQQLRALPVPIQLPRRDVSIWMHPDNRDKKDFIAFSESLHSFLHDAGISSGQSH